MAETSPEEWPAGVEPRWWSGFVLAAKTVLRAPLLALAYSTMVLALTLFERVAENPMPGIRFFAVCALLAILAANFWGWLRARRLLAALTGTPLVPLAKAMPGYVRLEGRARALPGERRLSPVTGRLCCWYRYKYDPEADRPGSVSRPRNPATPLSSTSQWRFALGDGAAECVVDPFDAQVVAARNEWQDDTDFRDVKESVILVGDALVVVGRLSRAGLQNVISRPADGRPFIVSSLGPRELSASLKSWSWLLALLFLLATAGGVYLIRF